MQNQRHRCMTAAAATAAAIVLSCLTGLASRAEPCQPPPRPPKRLEFETLVSSSCGEFATGGGCTSNSYEGIRFSPKGKAEFYRRTTDYCVGGESAEWTRYDKRNVVEKSSYVLRAGTFFINGSKSRFFVRLDKVIYSEKMTFYLLVNSKNSVVRQR